MNDNFSTYTICNNFDEKHKLDDNITHLKFGAYFSKILRKNDLPSKLTHLMFNDDYNEYIDKKVLPNGLTHLWLGDLYNRVIDKKVLPITLIYLHFGYYYNKPLNVGIIPDGLQELVIKMTDNYIIKKNVIPSNLNKLHLLSIVKFEEDILPVNLKYLFIPIHCINKISIISNYYKILLNNLPCQLEELSIIRSLMYITFNQNIQQPFFDSSCISNLPQCLKKIFVNHELINNFNKIPFGCEIINIG